MWLNIVHFHSTGVPINHLGLTVITVNTLFSSSNIYCLLIHLNIGVIFIYKQSQYSTAYRSSHLL